MTRLLVVKIYDIPFLNSVINIIYHMDNAQLTRYVGDYDQFSR